MTNKDKTYEDNLAATFLYKYFTSLIKSPESLKNFYLSTSIISRRYGNESSYRVVGFENLKESKLSKFAAVNLSSIDSQLTNSHGVFISCTGITYNEDNQSKSFHQSFLLEKIESSYYITNDIFVLSQNIENEQSLPDEASHLVSEQPQQPQDQPHLNGVSTTTTNDHKEEEDTTTTTATATSIIVKEEEQQQPPITVVVEPSKPVSETVIDKQEPIEEPQQQQNNKKEQQSKQQSKQQTQPSGTKPSLADLIKTTTPTTTTTTSSTTTTITATANSSPNNTTIATITASQSSTTATTAAATSSAVSSGATTQVALTKEHSQAAFTRDGCTIYFSNFKSTVKIESSHIRESLQQFGTIQNIKIFNVYGFVEFDKVESVQRLLAHVSSTNNKIFINNCQLNIEERKGGPPQKSNYKQYKDKRPQNTTNNINNTTTNSNNNKFQNNNNSKPRDNNNQTNSSSNNNIRKSQNNDRK